MAESATVPAQKPGAPSPRARVRRAPARAAYDRATIDAILDAALVAHVAVVDDGQPVAIPALHARVGDEVYLHGSTASRTFRALAAGAPACLTVTVVDGLVLARSAFHHSVNYRSVVVLGSARAITDPAQKTEALRAFTEQLVPGRWAEVRPPSPKELKGTAVVALPLTEASAKVRTGPPVDEEADYALDTWAGVLPLRTVAGPPIGDPRLRGAPPVPAHVTGWRADARQTSTLTPPRGR